MKAKKVFSIPPVPAVLLSIVSVQAGAAIAKGIFPVLGAATTASLRIILSAVILIAFNRPNLSNLTSAQWKTVTLYGITLGLMNLTFYLAIERIPLGLGVTLESIGPLVLALTGSKKLLDFLWVILAAAGIALIAPWSSKGVDLTGVLLALLAGALWSAYIVIGGRISKIMDSGKAVTIGMVVASFVIIPFVLASGFPAQFKPAYLVSGLALALLSSAIPFTLEMNALGKIPAKTFSILLSLEPAAGALSGLIFLNERLSVFEWMAVFLVVIASSGAAITVKRLKS